MKFKLRCKICGVEMNNASKNHIREDYRKMLEQLNSLESNAMQFFDVVLQEEWVEE